mmetsp:Transcript_36510/g.95336  ORF Transcript_36510/g.95336 Transcript_36510/m.95336 type:complete len:254 (-) Transcript_36510:63-824(-)
MSRWASPCFQRSDSFEAPSMRRARAPSAAVIPDPASSGPVAADVQGRQQQRCRSSCSKASHKRWNSAAKLAVSSWHSRYTTASSWLPFAAWAVQLKDPEISTEESTTANLWCMLQRRSWSESPGGLMRTRTPALAKRFASAPPALDWWRSVIRRTLTPCRRFSKRASANLSKVRTNMATSMLRFAAEISSTMAPTLVPLVSGKNKTANLSTLLEGTEDLAVPASPLPNPFQRRSNSPPNKLARAGVWLTMTFS